MTASIRIFDGRRPEKLPSSEMATPEPVVTIKRFDSRLKAASFSFAAGGIVNTLDEKAEPFHTQKP